MWRVYKEYFVVIFCYIFVKLYLLYCCFVNNRIEMIEMWGGVIEWIIMNFMLVLILVCLI